MAKKSKSNKKLLLLLLLLIPIGFVTYFVLIDEPTQYQVQADDPVTTMDEEIVIELPPIEEVLGLEVPIPDLNIPIEISFTPIITLTDSLGVEDVIRGETRFLQALTLIQVGVPDKTFDNGNLKIELEFDTGNIFSREIFLVKPSLNMIDSNGTVTPITIPTKEKQGTDVISVIGVTTTTPDCNPTQPCVIGSPTNGIFTINVFDSAIVIGQVRGVSGFVDPNVMGVQKFDFILTKLDVNISEDIPVGIDLPPTPMPSLPLNVAIIPEDTQTRIEPVNFALVGSTQIYSVTFANVDLVEEVVIVEQMVNTTEIVVEEIIVEDTPFVPCPLPVKLDSISILFPSIEVSGTTTLWDKIIIDGKSHDIINVDIRNNRNCELTLAVGSEWKRVTGQILKSDIETFLVATNGTQPFRSLPFDGTVDCGSPAGNCGGLEIQWCFIAKATVDDVTEIVDPFCGKKFYR